MNRDKLEHSLEDLVRSKGELTVVSDARVCFLRSADLARLGGPDKLGAWQRLQSITQRQLFLRHSYTTPLTPRTALVATTQVTARQGSGAGNMLVKLQHSASQRLSLELGTTLLRPRALTCKATYAPDADSFLRVDVPIRTLAAPPKVNLVVGRRVAQDTTGTLTLRSGSWALGTWGDELLQPYSDSTVSVGLSHASGWAAEATAAVFVRQVSLSWARTVLGGFKVGVQGVVTNVGAASVGISADRRVTDNCKAGMGLEVAANGAMTVKLRCVSPSPLSLPLLPSLPTPSLTPRTPLCAAPPFPARTQLLPPGPAPHPPRHHLVLARLAPLRRLHHRPCARYRSEQPARARAAQAQAAQRVRRAPLSLSLVAAPR